jgi:endonuclease III
MKNQINIDAIHTLLAEHFVTHRMPIVDLIEIQTRDPFKVLLATILSSRTKDQVTAVASARLFELVTTPEELQALSLEQIEQCIYPVGFWKTKARHLKALPQALFSHFGGKVPETIEELVQLPGVGRKTANLVVAVGFGKPALCVDVHVHRITNRLGYVKTATPFETEMALRQKLPLQYWLTFNAYFVSFGQNSCTPINPHCSNCPIIEYCNRVGVKTRFEPN